MGLFAMCEVVEITAWRKKSARTEAQLSGPAATTFVMVPNERLSRLRDFWSQLKADIADQADEANQVLMRR